MEPMMRRLAMAWVIVVAMALGLCACGRDQAQPGEALPTTGSGPAARAAPEPAPVELADVIERDPRYIIGISYPPVAREHPGLARLLLDYADAARAELMQSVAGLGAEPPTAPYDLSLAFTEVVATPRLVTIAADGSSYTGGAHGNPLLARFTWLSASDEQLTAARLVPRPGDWQVVSDYVREELSTALSRRVESSGDAGERGRLLQGGLQMIEQGTTPEAGNFDQFEPVLDASGRIVAIRFVFPPYQVGPYSEGAQSVEVPAEVLLPVVAPGYRHLFEGG